MSSRKVMYMGIDPGASGGIVIIYPPEMDKYFNVGVITIPYKDFTSTEKLWHYLRDRVLFSNRNDLDVVCCIEKVGGFMGKEAGEKGGNYNKASAHTTFKFGMNYGTYLGLLTATEVIQIHEVAPVTWQKGLGITPRKKGESKSMWKSRLNGISQTLYPDLSISLATSDALLIATYGQRFIKPRKV